MAGGLRIDDAPLVDSLNGREKLPISDGSNSAVATTVDQIKDYALGGSSDSSTIAGRVTNLETNLANEIQERTEDISDLDTTKADKSYVEELVAQEESARESADSTLQANIDAEVSARENADTTLTNAIDSEASTRESADNTLQANIDAEAEARATAVSNEATTRANADASLQTAIESEASTRASQDNALNTAIANEVSARQSADTSLQTSIQNEATARANADTTLQSNINVEANTRSAAVTTLTNQITAEQSARENADASLQSAINTEASAREDADTTLQTNIDNEASVREQADETLQNGIEANANAIEELDTKKANVDGYYPQMTVGLAENLVSPDGVTDTEPYLFRTTAGSNSVSDGYATIEEIRGNSIVWNQLVPIPSSNQSKTENGVTITDNRDGSYTISTDENGATANVEVNALSGSSSIGIVGHKYLETGINGGSTSTYRFVNVSSSSVGNTSVTKPFIFTAELARIDITIRVQSGAIITTPVIVRPQLIDLTLMFGAGNEPTTVEEFTALYPQPYYDYTSAPFIVNNTVDTLETVGFNQWDEKIEIGSISTTTGANTSNTGKWRSKNYIKVLPNTNYYIYNKDYSSNNVTYPLYYDLNKNYLGWGRSYKDNSIITTPDRCYYMRIMNYTGETYNNNICINYSWSGYRNGDYEAYWKNTLDLSAIKSIKDANGNLLFADGPKRAGDVYDVITSSKATKKVGTRAYQEGDANSTTMTTDGVSTTNYVLDTPVDVDFTETPQVFGTSLNLDYKESDWGTENAYNSTEEDNTTPVTSPFAHQTLYMDNLRDKIRNIDGSSDGGALMNTSLTQLLTTLGTALNGTITKTWNDTYNRWDFTFTANE